MSNSQPTQLRPNPAGRLAFILDDEPQVRAIVGKILASIGFEPHQFAVPAALFADLKNDSPELIVLDLALGQSDAVEVIRHLETFRYPGKVLLISGRDQATLGEIQRIGEHHGLTMLTPIQKPFRGADIRNSLEAAGAAAAAAAIRGCGALRRASRPRSIRPRRCATAGCGSGTRPRSISRA